MILSLSIQMAKMNTWKPNPHLQFSPIPSSWLHEGGSDIVCRQKK